MRGAGRGSHQALLVHLHKYTARWALPANHGNIILLEGKVSKEVLPPKAQSCHFWEIVWKSLPCAFFFSFWKMWVRSSITLGNLTRKGHTGKRRRAHLAGRNHKASTPPPWLPLLHGKPPSLFQKTLFTNLVWDVTHNLLCLLRRKGSGKEPASTLSLQWVLIPHHLCYDMLSCPWPQAWDALGCASCAHRVWGRAGGTWSLGSDVQSCSSDGEPGGIAFL